MRRRFGYLHTSDKKPIGHHIDVQEEQKKTDDDVEDSFISFAIDLEAERMNIDVFL